MKGDFSRRTSENGIARGYTQVLQQQGRVQLDADWNEQQALHQFRDETEAQQENHELDGGEDALDGRPY